MEQLREYLKSERGNLKRLAEALHLTPGAINQWRIVPAEYLVDIEAHTGVPREQLRPELYRETAA